ncbi:ABC transporter ATP-binding protein [Saccharomonospora iraqiensis]|uniref:ABC transporter ATP-binding protein n=1 Tax=Saccharomonospora iraqiensis TaxID=52698 RepID=UPI002D21CB20|nr:ABC transporter ATP-binding protein [Saccharomonospora iraqiensis]
MSSEISEKRAGGGMEPGAAITIENLTKNYGNRRGVVDLSLDVRTGEVLGFLGPNGAGKSTTIRVLLDLIRPTSGRVRVLGAHPRTDAVALHRRVGHLAGDAALPMRQTVDECLAFLGALRGGVDPSSVDELTERLGLDRTARIGELSTGNRRKVGLVQALMHRPELLVLDEPTSGLDPLAQRVFLELVREARREGRTVFLSSHVLSEVEAVADRVAIVREGRLVSRGTPADLRAHAALDVRIDFDPATPPDPADFRTLPGVTDLVLTGTTLRCGINGPTDPLVKAAARYTVARMTAREPDLEELFLRHYDGQEAGDRVVA